VLPLPRIRGTTNETIHDLQVPADSNTNKDKAAGRVSFTMEYDGSHYGVQVV
jgi:hypothetical protein